MLENFCRTFQSLTHKPNKTVKKDEESKKRDKSNGNFKKFVFLGVQRKKRNSQEDWGRMKGQGKRGR